MKMRNHTSKDNTVFLFLLTLVTSCFILMAVFSMQKESKQIVYATGLDPTPTPDCCQQAVVDLNWDNSTTETGLCVFAAGFCTTTGNCIFAFLINDDAIAWASAQGLGFNETEAIRHAYWSLKISEGSNTCSAKEITDAHEVSVPGICGDIYKDLFNNKVGRTLAGQSGSCEDRVLNALSNGDLQTFDGCN